ncbi:MAG: hypothetical protein ABMA25_16565 [Ilumatobacteraceae bacterium]
MFKPDAWDADATAMEDAIADESYRVLAASLMGSGTDVLPVTEATADATDAPGPVTGPVLAVGAPADEDANRIVTARPHHHHHLRLAALHEEGSNHHTLVPRLMVVTSMLAALGFPLFLLELYRQGHFDMIDWKWYFDERGRRLALSGVYAIGACFCLGWCWWTAAAALNARNKARYSISPIFGPVAIATTGACVYLLPRALTALDEAASDERLKLWVLVVGLCVVPVLAYFATVGTFSRTAGAIGASRRPWLVIIGLPWVMGGLFLFSRFFTTAVGDGYWTMTGVIGLVLIGGYVLALYFAMTLFDRSCAGRHMSHDDRGNPELFRTRN